MAIIICWKILCCAVIATILLTANRVACFSQFRSRRPHSLSKTYKRCSHDATYQITPELEMAEGEPHSTSSFVVALTREEGKNDKLRKALLSNKRIEQISDDVQIHELPCIEHADGPDTEKLVPTISSSQFDYIAITSPEAAKIFATAWIEAGKPEMGMVAAVGKATQESLKGFGLDVAFVPSKATAATLVKELPQSDIAVGEGRATTVFYPASAKAQDTLQNGLQERGFTVLRLNTYDTVPASWTDEQISLAQSATVACFASPSAVKAWLKNTSDSQTPRVLSCCIGETSASACRTNGWEETDIFYPEKPGVEGWAVAVADALEYLTSC